MTPDAMAQALALYTAIRDAQDPDALQAWASWDGLPSEVTTLLPVDVCCRLTQYARCRRSQARWRVRKWQRLIDAEQRRIDPIERYFTILADVLRKAKQGDA